MATHNILAPDGRKFEIEAPDDVTREQVVARLMNRYRIDPEITPSLEAVENAPGGFVQGMRDPIDAGAQLLERALPESVVNKVNQFNNWLADQGLPLQRMGEGGLDQSLRENAAAYDASRVAEGDTGIDWDRLGGNILSPANAAGIGLAPMAATIPGRMATAATVGGLSGAVSEPVLSGDFASEKLKQMAFGAGGGALLGGVAEGLTRLGNRANRPEVQQLREMGVEPTIGQSLGGGFGRAEEKLMSAPIVGDMVSSARARALSQYNRGVLDQVAEPLRKLVPDMPRVSDIGQGGQAQVQGTIDQGYDLMRQATPEIQVGPNVSAGIADIANRLKSAPKDSENSFIRFIQNDLERVVDDRGAIPSKDFKRLDSEIGKNIRKTTDKYLKESLLEVQTLLRIAAAEQSPEFARAMKAADTAFAMNVRVSDAVNRASRNEGVFTPNQLIMSAKKADDSAGKRATARGDAFMQPIGTVGQNVLGDVVPDSGTAGRTMMNVLAGGGAYAIDPMILAAMGVGAGMYTPAVQRALTGGAMALDRRFLPPGVAGAIGGYAGSDVGR